MIFAAGVGSRLGKYTQNKPKALIEVGGITLIERAIEKLIAAHVTKIIINTHHFAQQIEDFIGTHPFSAEIILSYEPVLLETGGGLKKAARLFSLNQNIILYNVDIISNIDLERMHHLHAVNHHLATLAVRNRQTERYILFDAQNCFCGRENVRTQERRLIKGIAENAVFQRLAFSGIHIISPDIFPYFPALEAFSIIDLYFSAATALSPVVAYPHDDDSWTDVGKITVLEGLH